MPKAKVNGVETYYEVHGEGAPLVLMHGGYGGTMTTIGPAWAPSTLFSSDPVLVVEYHRRCTGQSAYTLDEYTLEDLAEDARKLLTDLGIDSSIVIGVSAGGWVALQYALLYPQDASALCLMETGAGPINEITGGEQWDLVERARAEGDRALFESQRNRLRNPPEPPDVATLPAGLQQRVRLWREAALAELQELSDEELFLYSTGEIRNRGTLIDRDLTERLGELNMPVCIVHGTADTVVPFKHGQALHRGIPHSEFEVIEGGLHEDPRLYAAMRDWVLRVAPRM